jgi:RNA polymerase sigma-70 factor (ECF subfamily)
MPWNWRSRGRSEGEAPAEARSRDRWSIADEQTLLDDLRQGRPRALDELSRRYRARIVRLSARYVRNASDAEDLAQDVLLKVWRHIGRFEGPTRLWPWIARITVNASISHLRARHRQPAGHPSSAGLPDEWWTCATGPCDGRLLADDQAMLAQFRERATVALRGLPPAYRHAVVLMDIRQYSTAEASRSLGVPVPTVKSRAIRGRRLLRHALAAFEEGLGIRLPLA